MNKPRILIVDDEEGLRAILSKVLSEEGYEVASAASGEEAVELIKAKPVDLSLVDLKMPGMDGIQTIRKIKEINNSIINVIITAYGQMESVREAAELGVYDYITKPFDLEYVKALIKHLLVDVKPQALPFAADMEKTLTGELTQRQANVRKFALLRKEAQARAEALKLTVKKSDERIADMYESFMDFFIYRARLIVDNVYFRVILICVIVGAIFGYSYTVYLSRRSSIAADSFYKKRLNEKDIYELYNKLDRIERKLENEKKSLEETPGAINAGEQGYQR